MAALHRPRRGAASRACAAARRALPSGEPGVAAGLRADPVLVRRRPLRGTVWGGVKRAASARASRPGRLLVRRSIRVRSFGRVPTCDLIPSRGDNAIAHHWVSGIPGAFSQKHRRYVRVAGRGPYRSRRDHRVPRRSCTMPLRSFSESFVAKRGYLDGFTGLTLSLFWAWFATSSELALKRRLDGHDTPTRVAAAHDLDRHTEPRPGRVPGGGGAFGPQPGRRRRVRRRRRRLDRRQRSTSCVDTRGGWPAGGANRTAVSTTRSTRASRQTSGTIMGVAQRRRLLLPGRARDRRDDLSRASGDRLDHRFDRSHRERGTGPSSARSRCRDSAGAPSSGASTSRRAGGTAAISFRRSRRSGAVSSGNVPAAGSTLRSTMAGDLELWARFYRHAELWGVRALLGAYRSQPAQKTLGRLERYLDEAEAVLRRRGGNPYGRLRELASQTSRRQGRQQLRSGGFRPALAANWRSEGSSIVPPN